MRWTNRTQNSFPKSFFSVFILGYFRFYLSPRWASKYHFSNSTRTVLAKGFLGGKAVTLWDELTEYKQVSQKPYFQFLTKIFPFSFSPLWASNYHFPNDTRTVLAKGFLGEGCNSLRWISKTQSSFWESFFPVFNGRYFLFQQSPLWASKYPFANSTRTALAKGFLKGKM